MPHKSKPQLYRELADLKQRLAEAEAKLSAGDDDLVTEEQCAGSQESEVGEGQMVSEVDAGLADADQGFQVIPLPPGVMAGTGAMAAEGQETDRQRTERILAELDRRLAARQAQDAVEQAELARGGYDRRGMEAWRNFMRRMGRA